MSQDVLCPNCGALKFLPGFFDKLEIGQVFNCLLCDRPIGYVGGRDLVGAATVAQAGWQREQVRRAAEKRELEALRGPILARTWAALESDFLGADAAYRADPDAGLLDRERYERLKVEFLQQWASREKLQHLDDEQAAAVAASEGDIQLVARAGSGKTSTLVARAIFLQRHCGVASTELLLLAFNKKAASEMKERLEKSLKGDLPHVMTFHALAHALVHPQEELIFDDAGADQFGLAREVQEVIDEHVRSVEHRDCIRELMLAHFRDDWERIVDGRFHVSIEEFLSYRRSLPRESLKGDYVKSFGEKAIANALFEHGVSYRYERNFRWNNVNYRPDFTIQLGSKGGVIIEYFGMEGDADYDEMSNKKRAFWAEQQGWAFLEFSPADIARRGVEGFVDTVIGRLRKLGLSCERLSEEELWELVKGRALDSFTAVMRTFIIRCRKQNLSADGLAQQVAGHTPCLRSEALFLTAGAAVYRAYLARLAERNKEDFDGLMWRAVVAVQEGQTRFVRDKGRERGDLKRLRFVMVDESQDLSQEFVQLLNSIRSHNDRVQFFCVGDDWQAINGFAGSDLEFFEHFDRYFVNTRRYFIRTNYRSPTDLVDIGNAVMTGRGVPARGWRAEKGWVRICDLGQFRPSPAEQVRHNGDEMTPALLRLLRRLLDDGNEIVMLSRRNGLPWFINYGNALESGSDVLARFLEHVRCFLPEEDRGRVTISTAHKYKGLERAAVVVLDATNGSYPLIHPNWVFLRIFGDTPSRIEQEERRLFYVAITRSQHSLALMTEMVRPSPYLYDACRQTSLAELDWSELPPVASLSGSRLEIRVSGATFDVRDQLKDLNYRWDAPSRCWVKSTLADGFSFDALLKQSWVRSGIRVQVLSETGDLLQQH